jgi:ADP-ribose pyrophosphatase YjhB (NUDIX family)
MLPGRSGPGAPMSEERKRGRPAPAEPTATAPARPPPGAPRRFCRFSDSRPTSEGFWRLPTDGMCLSVFVILSPAGQADQVLVGQIDPSAPWARIGALDPARVRLWREVGDWMLPSCHLQFYESPQDAGNRILAEQLGLEGIELSGPQVFSETYTPPRHPTEHQHWDLDFLFRGELARSAPPHHPAWRQLRFLAPSSTPRRSFTRLHDDILELAGYRFGDAPTGRPPAQA